MKTRLAIALLLGTLGLFNLAAAEPLDTPAQLKKMFADGNYKDLIPKLSKIVALKGPEADAYNKYDLLTMKGEASLRTKSKSGATESFKQAAKFAKTPVDVSTANATAFLIQQASATFKYTPKTKADKTDKPEPIDIVEAASRKSAFDALQKDMTTRNQAKVDAALKNNTIAALVQEAKDKDLSDQRDVEIAATGTGGDTKQMFGDLATHTATLLDGALDKIQDQLNGDIMTLNKSGQPAKAGSPTINTNTALSAVERDVHSAGGQVQEIDGYAVSLTPVFGDAADFKSIQTKAKKVMEFVNQTQSDLKKHGAH